MEMVKLAQVFFIMQDVEMYDPETDRPMECRALNITEDLGQIQYIFSDKTGTLTENRMEFKSCTVGGVNYLHVPCDDDLDSRSDSYSHQSYAASSRTSSIVENLSLEPALQRELSNMCLRSLDSVELTIPPHVRRVQEFFLLMAVCNTVVVSYIHEDLMDDSGYIADDPPPNKPGPIKPLPVKDTLEKPNINKMNMQSSTPSSLKSRSLLSLSVSESGDASESGSVAGSSFLSVGSQRMHYEAESPDELALVKAANTYGCKLTRRSPGKVTVAFPAENDEVELEVLNILHFDATRKRMSVIVRHPMTRNIILYVKGADSSIFSVLHPKYETDEDCKRELKNTQDHLDGYARKGLRTLCMAKRVLGESEYQAWAVSHKAAESDMNEREELVMRSCVALEKDLELLGATGIEDKLQEGVPSTIANLRQAGIKVWVLTGDKQETAIQIANSCQLFSPDQTILTINASSLEETREALDNALAQLREDQKQLDLLADSSRSHMGSQVSLFSVLSLFSMGGVGNDAGQLNHALVIDGKTLAFATTPELERRFLKICLHCRSVVCCRATPIQKASVVKLVRDNLKKMTLSIGDGANDVSMIQTADIGVGISGQEGMQAVMASDFAIAKFRFLERLLLVHGHWNHDRLCKFSAIMFYKSLITVFILFWFQIFSGFSGSLMIDSLYLTMQHVVFTSLPPLANGVFDKDLSVETLISDPTLYKPGQRGEMYTHWTYMVVLLDSLYQSLALYFIPHIVSTSSAW
ncbi:phospholipid-transporting ATPase [Plakobranchus ocellatus]|uniref:Phospholipid-transporting ATPase n=1 Tax=Plakobranchus ocellatus TaxID=259542 RepID=A0AAV4DS63_9GAST|nr:phospholipid-transporting ATPase [Plakobranchus ocellatus]